MGTQQELQLLGAIFAGVGLVMFLIAVPFYFRTRRFLSTAVPTQGTIIELVEGTDSEGHLTYFPKVRFETSDGKPVEFEDSISSNSPSYSQGDKVPVNYDPQNPERARIGTAFRTWFVPGLLAAIGLPFFITGLVIFLIAM
jgi:hypothetical protein